MNPKEHDTVFLMPDATGRPRRTLSRPTPEPTPVWPVEGSTVSAALPEEGRVELHWSGAGDADFVWVEIADNPSFRPRLRAERFPARESGRVSLPPRAQPYFYRLRSEGRHGGLSSWSRPVCFRMVRADTPLPKSRADYWTAAEAELEEDLLLWAVRRVLRSRGDDGPGKTGLP